MDRRIADLLFPGALLLAVVLAGCTFGNTDLRPVPYNGSEINADEGWTEQTDAGVTVRATPVWHGDDSVLQQLTPIHVRIENRSGRALQLRYGAFTANTPAVDDKRHALPVLDYEHEDAADGLSSDRKLDASGFEVFAHLADEFPDVPVSQLRRATPDEAYHNRFRRRLKRLPIVLEDRVYIEALPEGVLADGGHVAGYVYFTEVEDDMDAIGSFQPNARVAFIVELIDVADGEPFGQVELAFEID